MRALLVLMVLPLAGCLSAPVDVIAEPAPEPVEQQTALPGADAVNASLLSGITAFYWAADGDIGDIAMDLTVDFGNDNACEVFAGVLGSTDEPGVRSVFIHTRGWSASGGGSLATVAMGPVDTREILGGSGSYGSVSGTSSTFDDVVTFTRVARNVHDIPEFADFLPHAMTFDLTCEDSFDILGARAGYSARVGDVTNLEGTIADVVLVGGAASGTAEAHITGEGHIRFGAFGDHVGTVTIASPVESEEHLLPVSQGGHLVGEDGTYTMDVTRAAARFEAFWFTMYGLQHGVDLESGLQEDASYESPF